MKQKHAKTSPVHDRTTMDLPTFKKKPMMLICMGAIAIAITGCGSSVEVPVNAQPHIMKSDVSSLFSDDGRIVRTAEVTLMLAGRSPHTFQIEAFRTLVKGDGDGTLAVNDITDHSSSLYTIGDDDASATVVSESGSMRIAQNPDETVSVNGTTFDDPAAAGDVAISTPAIAVLSPEALAAADHALNFVPEMDSSTPAGRGKVWKKVKQFFHWVLRHGVYVKVTCDTAFDCSGRPGGLPNAPSPYHN